MFVPVVHSVRAARTLANRSLPTNRLKVPRCRLVGDRSLVRGACRESLAGVTRRAVSVWQAGCWAGVLVALS
jgi:hypothetical protein